MLELTNTMIVPSNIHDNFAFSLRTVENITWSPDGRRIAGNVNAGGTTLVWDAATGNQVNELHRSNPDQAGESMAFSSRSSELFLLPTLDDPRLPAFSIWSVDRGSSVKTVPGPFPNASWRENRATQFVYAPVKPVLAAMFAFNAPHIIRLYDTSGSSPEKSIDEQGLAAGSVAMSMAVSRDGSTLAVGHSDGALLIYSTDSTNLRSRIDAYGKAVGFYVSHVAFTASGTYLAVTLESNSSQGVIRVFNVQSGQLIAEGGGLDPSVRQLSWMDDGQSILALYGRGRLDLWQWSGRNLTRSAPIVPQGASSFAMSPDLRNLAVAIGDKVNTYQFKNCSQ